MEAARRLNLLSIQVSLGQKGQTYLNTVLRVCVHSRRKEEEIPPRARLLEAIR